MFAKLMQFCFHRPKVIIALTLIATLAAIAQLPRIKVDTDPENMLPEKEFVRVFHKQVKKEFAVYDFIVLGIINEQNPNGVFNVRTLNKIYQITQQIKGIDGVIQREIISPSTKDNIRQGGVGTVIFEWLMKEPIETEEQALLIRDEALDNPMFRGTLVSEDGKALCLYIPIEKKDQSYRISQGIRSIISGFSGEEKYYITGLPVAEDTFGVEMFKQMAVSAPLAGLIIFLLMLFFFKSVKLIICPMILAVCTVLITMGLLIGLGFPVHIMGSMIPIFLMPIAVLDSVHILSEFSDKYRRSGNKRDTVFNTMEELFTPMLFTSLTSAVGFFSLSFSPIPPVQTFGVFVAIGILIAWGLTVSFIPAYIALLSEKSLESLGAVKGDEVKSHGLLNKLLVNTRKFSLARPRLIIAACALLVAVSIFGIARIRVNDNPVRWFTGRHSIRIADRILNRHFAGTYTAYLVMQARDKQAEVFKEPEMLRYIQGLQEFLLKEGDVGKSTSLADVVSKVYYELMGGDKQYNVIPRTKRAVSQCLISYENSHKPDDLWHLAAPDYSQANIWLQLKSGDNKDMGKVLGQVKEYFSKHNPPFEFEFNWAGLTYINLVWQNKMVVGMLKNFLGSFIIVFFMMVFLFRSSLVGLVSMVPLTITILFIYSLLGFFGKDYDMPVAVLSALTLGLSIDFAIHFIQRARQVYREQRTWDATAGFMFAGPSRAIVRNAVVIAVGFLPLLVAPLVPYRTVGFFMFSIMLVSSCATLIILPAIITLAPAAILERSEQKIVCSCLQCLIISIAVSLAVVYFLRGYTAAGWRPTIFISIAIIAFMGGLCHKISKHRFCVFDKKEVSQ